MKRERKRENSSCKSWELSKHNFLGVSNERKTHPKGEINEAVGESPHPKRQKKKRKTENDEGEEEERKRRGDKKKRCAEFGQAQIPSRRDRIA